MTSAAFICPRCLFTAPQGVEMRYCPKCGLAEMTPADQAEPVRLVIEDDAVNVGQRIAFGELCNLYQCTIKSLSREGVFKISRAAEGQHHVQHGHKMLSRLLDADTQHQAAPFLPQPVASVKYSQTNGEPPRQASVLTYCQGIESPIDLYTLQEVQTAYPGGIDARDMAWIWRRLLTILSFVHLQRIAHGSVTPDHVLIEPREHKLVLVGWCGAVSFGQAARLSPKRWNGWSFWDDGASPRTDLAAAARSMSCLLKPDADSAIKRHLERAAESSASAFKLLKDFDRLIEALWGPRQFRPFAMPQRGA